MENTTAKETSGNNADFEANSNSRGKGDIEIPGSMEFVMHENNGERENLKVALNVQPSSEILIVPKHVRSATDDGNSLASSCSSQKGKLRLHLELSLQPKEPIAVVLAASPHRKESNGRDADYVEDAKEPVTVMVDYPEDMKISVNARIHKLQLDPDSLRSVVYKDKGLGEDEEAGWKNDQLGSNQNDQVLNSTFVKATPLSSTLIYPILEAKERIEEVRKERSPFFAKSGSDEASLYQTVMGDAGFGNLSAISTTKARRENKLNSENEVIEVELEDPLKVVKKLPTLNLSGRSSYISLHKTTDELSAGEKLMKALHILAKYRGVWGIYEDEDRIVMHLRRLNEILGATDNATVQKTCKEDDYQEVRGLVSYFVLEKRFSIRSELLQTFSLLVEKSNAVANFIFSSEFPVVLAWEIARGNYVSKETYAYAYCFLQIIRSSRLTNFQCESAGVKFYSQIISMMHAAEKNYYGQVAELFFEIILLFHGQLDEDSDFKWKCLYFAASPANRTSLKKFKLKLINVLMRTADVNDIAMTERKMKDALTVFKDLIICDSTNGIFTNSELDAILLTLCNTLKETHLAEYNLEALKTVYRILVTIQKEPSGLQELRRLVKTLLKEEQEACAGGDRIERNCYWGILKKIYKILTM